MIDQFATPVFSLCRFFHEGEKALPCWTAGRFYPQHSSLYQLKSQKLAVLCRKTGHEPPLHTGDWLAVELLSKKHNVYQTGECRVLNTCSVPFQAVDFSYESKGQILKDWRSFLSAVENFFYSEGLAYAETPSLVKCPGTEPHLKAFETVFVVEGQTRKMHLPTSPEMHLKKLLCQDWTDFFEIKKCFRNGELGPVHQAELTLLEWYRAFYSTRELIEETYKLFSFLHKKDFCQIPLPPAEICTVRELFKKHLRFSLHPWTSKEELMVVLKDYQLGGSLDDSFEDLFFLIFLNRIEPYLPKEKPVFICDYPPQLRAFSRLKPEGWADRFELYWRGLELANAFYEVIDLGEQKRLFAEHLQQRKDSVPLDEELVSLMKQGMPPVSGIALGLDRLFLALYGKDDLKESRLFPL